MFPDLKIAQNYSQLKTKVKYNIQFGTTPYVKEILINDVNWQPLVLNLTKQRPDKLINGMILIQYHSKALKLITTLYW